MIEGSKDFEAQFNVSRETIELLEFYQRNLLEWQKVKNLVAAGTLNDIWLRHFADSAQLAGFLENSRVIVDLGSGAGFPGLVLGILLRERDGLTVHLVESNGRKCAFLREMARNTGASVEIHNCRIEVFASESTIPVVNVVTARALKPLDELISLSQFAFDRGARGVFLKGKSVDAELEAARRLFDFDFETHDSLTDENARIVEVSNVKPLV